MTRHPGVNAQPVRAKDAHDPARLSGEAHLRPGAIPNRRSR
jgi:hypothetical protein